MSNETKPRFPTPEEVEAAIAEARRMRAEAFWSLFRRRDKAADAKAPATPAVKGAARA